MSCNKCALGAYRNETGGKIVWGSGNTHAKIMLIGEAPGKEESEQGKPFVGRSGKKLRSILSDFLDVEKDIRIINTVMCRPPENRNPTIDEQNTCLPHIETQIRIIRPRLIMTAGRISSDWFSRFTHLTYNIYEMQEWKLDDMYALWLPLYHPSFFLRKPRAEPRFIACLQRYKGIIDKLKT